jgi:hypothetical protein
VLRQIRKPRVQTPKAFSDGHIGRRYILEVDLFGRLAAALRGQLCQLAEQMLKALLKLHGELIRTPHEVHIDLLPRNEGNRRDLALLDLAPRNDAWQDRHTGAGQHEVFHRLDVVAVGDNVGG